jgi:hypothetical protein
LIGRDSLLLARFHELGPEIGMAAVNIGGVLLLFVGFALDFFHMFRSGLGPAGWLAVGVWSGQVRLVLHGGAWVG